MSQTFRMSQAGVQADETSHSDLHLRSAFAVAKGQKAQYTACRIPDGPCLVAVNVCLFSRAAEFDACHSC